MFECGQFLERVGMQLVEIRVHNRDKYGYVCEKIFSDPEHEMVRSITFDNLGKRVCLTNSGGYLLIIDLRKNLVRKIKAHNGHCTTVAIDSTGKYYATGGQDNKICLWKITESKIRKLFEIQGHTATITCLKFDRQNRLYSASRDETIKVWKLVGLRQF